MGSSLSSSASLIGQTLGNYRVKSLIGRGAMGAVYLARDRALGRHVALKVLLGSLAQNQEQVRLFQLEAQAAAPLKHPHIVGIYEAGIRNGIPFIAMEYVEGESLEHFLRRQQTPLEWHAALHITQQVASALACAHKAGIVHRDVKPANILLDHQGRVRLADFGIANAQGTETNLKGGVEAAWWGTPEYMSPEQCEGNATITPATDLFSLGVTLYRILSGKMPFAGHTREALVNDITRCSPTRLTQITLGVPDDVARLTAHLLGKTPEERPANAEAVAETCKRLLRENGGASAVPEALNEFIREELQPRKVQPDTPTPTHQTPDNGVKIFLPQKRKQFKPISFISKAIVVLLFSATLASVGYWHYIRPRSALPSAPCLEQQVFVEESPGTFTVALPSGQWDVEQVRWLGDSSVALIAVTGRATAGVEGDSGILAACPEHKQIYSVTPPTGALTDETYWRRMPGKTILSMLPVVPQATPFYKKMPVQRCLYDKTKESASVLTLAQPWNKSQPQRTVYARTPLTQWRPALPTAWDSQTAVGASVVKPDGLTLCLVLQDEKKQSNYLAEQSLGVGKSATPLRRITPSNAWILPETVQYAPNGEFLLYMRQVTADEQRLWAVALDKAPADGRPLCEGALNRMAAISPDSQMVAVAQGSRDDANILLIDIAQGTRLSEMGQGVITSESWHPSGNYLVTAAPEPVTGLMQLWAVQTNEPHKRQLLTHLETGVLCGGAVSRNGRWVASVTRTEEGVALLFIDLSAQLFSA